MPLTLPGRPRGVTLVCALTLVAAAPAAAALPDRGAKFVAHDHATAGDGWHVELVVARATPRMVAQLVLHSERCRATVLASGVPIAADGAIDAARPFTASGGRQGTWRLGARFADPRHLRGSFQLATPGCDGGERPFVAHAGGHRHAGHAGHGHLYGTPPGTLPDLARATATQRRQARRLWRGTLRAARLRFPSYRAARALGFTRYHRSWRKPLAFHLRHAGYAGDSRVLDPWRPESLVYWWPVSGSPVLVAFMYRMPPNVRPRFAGPLLGWHTHGSGAQSQMTHVWITHSLRTALANCMPVAALEAANPAFRFAQPGQGFSHESMPCPSATAAASRTVRVGDNWFVRRRGVPTVTVARGDTVSWRFVGREPHNVRAASGPERFTSPTKAGGSWRRRMSRRGTYTLVCDIHGARDQRMRLVVR